MAMVCLYIKIGLNCWKIMVVTNLAGLHYINDKLIIKENILLNLVRTGKQPITTS